MATAAAWTAYDAAMAAYDSDRAVYNDERKALETWTKARGKLSKDPPTYDGAEMMIRRKAVEAAEALVKRLEAEERQAAIDAARAEATAEAERKAEEARVRAEAEAARPKPVADIRPAGGGGGGAASSPTFGAGGPTGAQLFAQPAAAPVYSPDYRQGFGDARDAAAAIVQWCRENGETDHRSMLHPIRGLTPENQNDRDNDSEENP